MTEIEVTEVHGMQSKSTAQCDRLPVGFLPASTGTMTTELLWFASPRVRDEQRPVVGDELLLELHCAVCVNVLRVVRNERLCDGLADSVHLRGVSTTLHAEADVNGAERLLTGNEDRLVDLQAENLGRDERDGRAVEVDKTATLLGMRDRRGSLLFAERLNSLGR